MKNVKEKKGTMNVRSMMKLMLIVITFTVMVGVLPSKVSAAETDVDTTHFYGDQLTELERKIYDKLYERYYVERKMGNVSVSFKAPGGSLRDFSNNASFRAIAAFELDYSELGLGGGTWEYNETNGNVTLQVHCREQYQGAFSEAGEAMEAAEAYIDEIDAYLPENPNRFDIVSTIALVVCKNNTYSFSTKEENHNSDARDEVVGSFQSFTLEKYNHRGLCGSYASLFHYLCKKYEVPCIEVIGKEFEDDDVLHQWNQVQMEDGEWYVVDTTWMDNPLIDDIENDDVLFEAYDLFNWITYGMSKEMIKQEKNPIVEFLLTGSEKSTNINSLYLGYTGTIKTPFAIPDLAAKYYYESKDYDDMIVYDNCELYVDSETGKQVQVSYYNGEKTLTYGKEKYAFLFAMDVAAKTRFEELLWNVRTEYGTVCVEDGVYLLNSVMFSPEDFEEGSTLTLEFLSNYTNKDHDVDIVVNHLPNIDTQENIMFMTLETADWRGFFVQDALENEEIDTLVVNCKDSEDTFHYSRNQFEELVGQDRLTLPTVEVAPCEGLEEEIGEEISLKGLDSSEVRPDGITVVTSMNASEPCYLYLYDSNNDKYDFVQELTADEVGRITIDQLSADSYVVTQNKIAVIPYTLIIVGASAAVALVIVIVVIVMIKRKKSHE